MSLAKKNLKNLSAIKLNPVRADSAEDLVTKSHSLTEGGFPLVFSPKHSSVNLINWAKTNRKTIENELIEYGAILFRGFEVSRAGQLAEFIRAISGEAMEYVERSSPRSQVEGQIYTSTDYPPEYAIFPHNENSYAHVFPRKIFFFCVEPAGENGETPLVDVRRVYRRLAPPVIEKFERFGVLYVRNFSEVIGLSWQAVFQSENKAEVEEKCRRSGYLCEWKSENRLRTKRVGRAVLTHPRIREKLWFNHAAFFHASTLPEAVREGLTAQFAEEDLPNNTYYGDGSPIEAHVLDEIRAAYAAETVKFKWQQGDVLLVDNLSIAHGREPFAGKRKILVGMSEPTTHEQLASEGAANE